MAESASKSIHDNVPDDGRAKNFLKSTLTSFGSYGVLAVLALFCVFAALTSSTLTMLVFGVLAITAWDTFRLWKKRSRLGHRAVVRALLVLAVGVGHALASPDDWLLASIAAVAVVGPIFFESLLAKGTNSK